MQSHIRHSRSFAQETTLAGRGYLNLVDQLRNAWRSGWPMVGTTSQRQTSNVVSRSLRHLFDDFSARVDACHCYMNGGPAPELVFEQTGNRRVVHHTAYLQHLLSEAGS